jgi:hypothetical protein
MARLLSVSYTTQAVRERRKTVTRRLGWGFVSVGDRLTLCAKVMGRKPGEPIDRITDVEVIGVRRERLDAITQDDVAREGYGMDREDWIRWYADTFHLRPSDPVTRIEWRYLEGVS